MKKKILLCAILSSVALSIYPAKVLIRNQTDTPVFARVNNQKRSKIFWEDQADLQKFLGTLMGASDDFSMVPFLPITDPAYAIHRAIAGYPNFIKIGRNQSFVLGTALVRLRGEEGGSLGKPITKITFARVKGHKTITGTIRELQSRVKDLANKYGDIELKDLPLRIQLKDNLSHVNKSWEKKFEEPEKYEKFSIEMPILEEFTYELGKNKIGMRKQRIVVLKSWGNAVLGSFF
ncbi:hypothetical protein E3J61_01995 [Candidatus Dependentiae bacterium]|nr:MAG: hypothetical protein E3J61_01995 [Candidatus Dependentiae bacterium]